MNKQIDYLIVGQGLAGTFLAFQLLQRKKSFLVIDQGHETSSSFVAAGVINPLVLKRLTKTWRANDFLKYNTAFYNKLETLLNKKYHFEIPVQKLISSKDEEYFWQHRFEKDELESYIDKNLTNLSSKIPSPFPFKVGTVKQTSWLNISELLKDFRSFLIKENMIINTTFNYSELKANLYQGITYKKIVFCEGANVVNNPNFNYLPMGLNKGQLFTIESEQLATTNILKKKVFILPQQKRNQYKIGATYSWQWDDLKVEEMKTELLKKQLAEMISAPYKIIKTEAGVRPASRDRRPLVGQHPKNNDQYIFNGMGSKGCFMAPLLSSEFIDFTEYTKALHPEMDIKRFNDLLS